MERGKWSLLTIRMFCLLPKKLIEPGTLSAEGFRDQGLADFTGRWARTSLFPLAWQGERLEVRSYQHWPIEAPALVVDGPFSAAGSHRDPVPFCDRRSQTLCRRLDRGENVMTALDLLRIEIDLVLIGEDIDQGRAATRLTSFGTLNAFLRSRSRTFRADHFVWAGIRRQRRDVCPIWCPADSDVSLNRSVDLLDFKRRSSLRIYDRRDPRRLADGGIRRPGMKRLSGDPGPGRGRQKHQAPRLDLWTARPGFSFQHSRKLYQLVDRIPL